MLYMYFWLKNTNNELDTKHSLFLLIEHLRLKHAGNQYQILHEGRTTDTDEASTTTLVVANLLKVFSPIHVLLVSYVNYPIRSNQWLVTARYTTRDVTGDGLLFLRALPWVANLLVV